MNPEEGQEKAPKVPDSVLRAALLRRAVEDIQRLIQIRSAKQACSTLLQRGSVGDDLWQRFLRAEKEMEEELRDVVMEVCSPPSVLYTRRWSHFYYLTNYRPGQRPRSELGANHLPIRQRNQRQHDAAQAARRDPV
jgi:Preprotein translocase subunit Sec66